MDKQNPEEYTKELKYLPEFMRDFHDQKDIFKTIDALYCKSESYKDMPQSWRDNHIYVIDFFLWFMGQHGYKLQRDRSNVAFYNISDTITHHKAEYLKKSFALLTPYPEDKQPEQ